MIVITSMRDKPFYVFPGDQFHLTVSDDMGATVVLTETITVSKVIDYTATFRFAAEDGTVLGFHLSGIFGNKKELPTEIANAVMLKDLTPEQRANFERTCSILLKPVNQQE